MEQPQPTETTPTLLSYPARVLRALIVLGVLCLVVSFVYQNTTTDNARFPFQLGLDLAGGSHLVYEADTEDVAAAEVPELMQVLRSVIERRVNVFGVSEPVVQVEESSIVSADQAYRLVVELPGVTEVSEAVAEIGRTPLLEFKLVDQEAMAARAQAMDMADSLTTTEDGSSGGMISNVRINGERPEDIDPYVATGLTGRYLASAALQFAGGQGGQLANEPIVAITFNQEGAELFESITRDHTGQQLAIFLDGELISAPRINEPISGGQAVISGGFDPDEARALAQNLNFGALPLPIELVSTQTIGASLGASLLEEGVQAAVYGLVLVALFMVAWYRALGVAAVVSLGGYVAIMLALFQLIPVTLTAAGLAGFVLSLGMAVDANVLVFERVKEEWKAGKRLQEAVDNGFARAWSAIRDGNVTSIISAVILFWFGTSIVKGFALVFGIGIIVSMFSALVVTRTLTKALPEIDTTSTSWQRRLYPFGTNKK